MATNVYLSVYSVFEVCHAITFLTVMLMEVERLFLFNRKGCVEEINI